MAFMLVLKSMMPLPQASKPVLGFFCVFMAFMLVLKSTWYTNLSTIGSLCVTVIGLVYVILTAFVRRLAAKLRERERIQVGPRTRLGLKVVIYGIIMFLMDPFGEHQPNYILAAALFFSAFHVHFQTHSFEVYEDLGLSQGLITVAVAALVHLAKRGTMKICVMLFVVVLQALYDSFERWDIPPREGHLPRRGLQALNDTVLTVADDWRSRAGRLAKERLAEAREAAREVEERLAEERLEEAREAAREAEERLTEERLAEPRKTLREVEERLVEARETLRKVEERLAEARKTLREVEDEIEAEMLAEDTRKAEDDIENERIAEEIMAEMEAERLDKKKAAAMRRRIRRRDRMTDEMADDEIPAALHLSAEERNRQNEKIYNAADKLKKKGK